MNQADLIWMNGEFVAWEDAKVHVLTHALHYGTGVFEGVRAYETARGTAVFRHQDHVDRLFEIVLVDRYKPGGSAAIDNLYPDLPRLAPGRPRLTDAGGVPKLAMTFR